MDDVETECECRTADAASETILLFYLSAQVPFTAGDSLPLVLLLYMLSGLPYSATIAAAVTYSTSPSSRIKYEEPQLIEIALHAGAFPQGLRPRQLANPYLSLSLHRRTSNTKQM